MDSQERIYEEERLKTVSKVIEEKIQTINKDSGGVKEEVVQLRHTFWDDVKVNFDHAEEAAETLSSIKQQAQLLSERERSQLLMIKQYKTLTRLKENPYFARIDFYDPTEEITTQVYLGVSSLMNQNETEFLIYDWRAPISSMYYDYSPGKAQYETADEVIKGEMLLKRQFIIKNSQLKSMFDTGVTIGDELLKEVLGNRADTNMKNIVATIQKEQNQIIRNIKSRYLIVQGAAGSGKTSAALQRVAYLLYRYQGKISADNIMLFSPNALFNSYVASVLPDLGEENMQQLTFQEYTEKRLGHLFNIEHPFEQMEYILTCQDDSHYAARMEGIRYKASIEFKQILDEYIKFLSTEGMIFKNISFNGEVIVPSQQIKDYFYSLDSTISIPNRIQLVKEWLLLKLSRKEKEERSKEWVVEESELLDHDEYTEVYSELRKEGRFSEDTFDDFEREQEKIARKLVQKHFKPLRKAVKRLRFIHMRALYQQLFQLDMVLKSPKFSLPEQWKEISKYTIENLRKKELLYDDTAPYLYLQDQVEGQRINPNIRHLIIDEAQDYSPLQFYVIKQLFPSSRMTILGDFNQAIYVHTFRAPTLLSSELYEENSTETMLLRKSYRSTRQIIEFTKEILPENKDIVPFDRNGSKPVLIQVEKTDDLHLRIIQQMKQLQSNYETIAVIGKTMKECRDAYEKLNKQLDIQLMDNRTTFYEKGLLILPVYLAKGIEFDAVLIYNASEEQYSREFERKLFYTACTRAMHELYLFSLGEMTPFMKKIPECLYEYK